MAELLVLDDDDILRNLVSELLTDEGHQVTSASHGGEGLRILEDGARPDLIVLDMRMPVMDGTQFATELVARGIDIPLLLLSAGATSLVPDAIPGVAGYLAKPFDIDELAAAVRQLLPVGNSGG